MAAAAGGQAFEQSLQHLGAGGMIIADICHQLPGLLPDFVDAVVFAGFRDVVLCCEQSAQELLEFLRAAATEAEAARDLVEILHADQFAGEMQQIAGIFRAEQLHHHRGRGPHIFHRVIAIGFFQPRFRPAGDRQCRRGGGVEHWSFEMAREHQPLIDLERVVVFAVIALEPILAVDALLGADEAEIYVAQRHAIVGMPSPQHRARHFARHAADRGAAPDPARRRIADPGLAIGFVHVFDMNAADPVGEVMILRRRHRRRQMAEPEFLQPRQEAFLLLASKHSEYELGSIGRAAPGYDRQNEAGEESVIEIGNAAPSLPFFFIGINCRSAHLCSRSL